jgi:RNA polymerase sigma-70 factor (ECF subfamily)
MKECCNINEVISNFYTAIYLYTLKRVKDVALVEDIVQEVMLRICQAHNKNIPMDNVRAWLYQTTRFVIADHFREKAKLNIHLSEKITELATDKDETKDISVFSDGILAVIDLLPEKYSTPLKWSDLDGVPQKESATKLNLSLSATKMRIQRGRQKIHQLFTECCDIIYDKNGAFVSCTIKSFCKPLLDIEDKLRTYL